MTTKNANKTVDLNKKASAETITKPQAEVKTESVAKSGNTETIVAATPKTHIANAVFKEMFGREQIPARKDMIAAAMKQANISKDCAATYLQNYKRKNGLQKNSAPATA